MHFTSEKPIAEGEGEVVGDELDEVYGTPSSNSAGGSKKKVRMRRAAQWEADTNVMGTHDLIKQSLEVLYKRLLRMGMEKK